MTREAIGWLVLVFVPIATGLLVAGGISTDIPEVRALIGASVGCVIAMAYLLSEGV